MLKAGALGIKRLTSQIPSERLDRFLYPFSFFPKVQGIGGKTYRKTVRFLRKSQWWSEDQHRFHQKAEIQRLLHHAYRHTKYYKELLDKLHCKPEQFVPLQNFRELPFLTKEILRNRLNDLIADNLTKNEIKLGTSGGSTGNPVEFYERKTERKNIERAYIELMWARVGYNPRHRVATLRGHILPRRTDGYHWRFNPKVNELILSSYHITEETAPLYAELINRYRVKYFVGYPSAIYQLCSFLDGTPIRFPSLKGILCASEKLYDWQREIVSKVFECRVFSHYGLSERAVLGGECEYSEKIHLFPEYGYTELIDQRGDSITKPGILGEIIATGFTNYATPFIRYRTGDMGIWSDEVCACGRRYPILSNVEGRSHDLVETKDRRWITLTALIFAQHFHAFSRIEKLQLTQTHTGKLLLKIVKGTKYSYEDENELANKILTAADGQLELSFQYVDVISTTARGKHVFLVQKLNPVTPLL